MKKQVWGILAAFGLMFFLFSTVYYFSYRDLKEQQELAEGEKGTGFWEELRSYAAEQSRAAADGQEADEEKAGHQNGSETEDGKLESGAAGAAKLQELTVSPSMRYVCQSYDPEAGELTEQLLPMPEEYLGLTRSELVSKLSQEEDGKALVVFSDSRLVVRDRNQVNPEDYKFLLLIEEGYLTVYYSDRHDVYLETYVTEDELPAAEVPALKRGYYVKSEAELYDYLQSVTS